MWKNLALSLFTPFDQWYITITNLIYRTSNIIFYIQQLLTLEVLPITFMFLLSFRQGRWLKIGIVMDCFNTHFEVNLSIFRNKQVIIQDSIWWIWHKIVLNHFSKRWYFKNCCKTKSQAIQKQRIWASSQIKNIRSILFSSSPSVRLFSLARGFPTGWSSLAVHCVEPQKGHRLMKIEVSYWRPLLYPWRLNLP